MESTNILNINTTVPVGTVNIPAGSASTVNITGSAAKPTTINIRGSSVTVNIEGSPHTVNIGKRRGTVKVNGSSKNVKINRSDNRSCFMRLTTEIRNIIYGYAFTSEDDPEDTDLLNPNPPSIDLALLCREVYKEAKPVFQ
jgi:hypothetical protein